MTTFVLYHKNCVDGRGAAYSAYTVFGDTAVYIPVAYGKPLPEELLTVLYGPQGKQCVIYILDFSYDRETLLGLERLAGGLRVIDHHKSAQRQLGDLEFAIFDMKRSGAYLAWKYFHPGTPIPKLIQYISDRDLWSFKLEKTNEVNAALQMHDMQKWETWDYYIQDEHIHELEAEGKLLIDYKNFIIQEALERVKLVTYKGYTVGFVNTSCLVSDIGQAICKEFPVDFSMSYFLKEDGMIVLSFRGQKKEIDLSVLAHELGVEGHKGGGHVLAAGAVVKPSFIDQFINQ